MKTKTTLLWLTVVVALGVYIKYESKGPNTAEARRQAQNMVNFDREKLDGIVIQNGDDKIELRRQDRKWLIEAPFKDQADNGAMILVLNAAAHPRGLGFRRLVAAPDMRNSVIAQSEGRASARPKPFIILEKMRTCGSTSLRGE